jgi:hypothetical protein
VRHYGSEASIFITAMCTRMLTRGAVDRPPSRQHIGSPCHIPNTRGDLRRTLELPKPSRLRCGRLEVVSSTNSIELAASSYCPVMPFSSSNSSPHRPSKEFKICDIVELTLFDPSPTSASSVKRHLNCPIVYAHPESSLTTSPASHLMFEHCDIPCIQSWMELDLCRAS